MARTITKTKVRTKTMVGIAVATIVVGGALAATIITAGDKAVPKIVSLKISPTSVDSVSSDQAVKLEMSLTDETGNDISAMKVQMKEMFSGQTMDFGGFRLVSGDVINGKYEASGTIKKGFAAGLWDVSKLVLRDTLGNTFDPNSDTLWQMSGSGPSFRGMRIVNYNGDHDAPRVTKIEVDPTVFDTITKSQKVTLKMTVTDSTGFQLTDAAACSRKCGLSDIEPAVLFTRISSKTGSPTTLRFDGFTKTSGDSKSGVYSASATLDKGSADEKSWKIESILVGDILGNIKSYSGDSLKTISGAQVALIDNVVDTKGASQPATGDKTPPEIKAVSITPTTINTASANANVVLRLTVTDNTNFCPKRICIGNELTVIMKNGAQSVSVSNFRRTGGSGLSGLYMGSAIIKKGSAGGDWKIAEITVSDPAGNKKTYSYDDLAKKISVGSLSITNLVK